MQIFVCKNSNSAIICFQIMSTDPYFTSFLFLERNSATIRNILMVLGRFTEQINMECHMQE